MTAPSYVSINYNRVDLGDEIPCCCYFSCLLVMEVLQDISVWVWKWTSAFYSFDLYAKLTVADLFQLQLPVLFLAIKYITVFSRHMHALYHEDMHHLNLKLPIQRITLEHLSTYKHLCDQRCCGMNENSRILHHDVGLIITHTPPFLVATSSSCFIVLWSGCSKCPSEGVNEMEPVCDDEVSVTVWWVRLWF